MLGVLVGVEYVLSGVEPDGVEKLLDPPPCGARPVAHTGMYK